MKPGRAKEILVEVFLDSHDENDIRDYAYVKNAAASEDLRRILEGTQYDLACDSCDGELIYNDKEQQWFCPFCNTN